MGRNFPSATQLVHEMIGELRSFADMLAPQDRLVLDRFYEYAMNNRAAIANAASLMPMEATLLVILLEERKQTQRLITELQAQLEELRRDQQRRLSGRAKTKDP